MHTQMYRPSLYLVHTSRPVMDPAKNISAGKRQENYINMWPKKVAITIISLLGTLIYMAQMK